nr:transposase [sulfur-oxidizing endosymbiont of Gigantopelta aegis]
MTKKTARANILKAQALNKYVIDDLQRMKDVQQSIAETAVSDSAEAMRKARTKIISLTIIIVIIASILLVVVVLINVDETDQPVSQTARELGVNVNTLHTWISKYSKPVKTVANRSDEHIYDEVKRLKKELAKVIQERDLLKRPQRTLQGKLCEVRMDN